MDNIKKLQTLVLKSTSESTEQITQGQLQQILELVNSRADMPKHVIGSISKRMAIKNKRVLINCFTLLQFLIYESELALYSQVATKEFLFKISGLLMNKDVDPEVKNKIMETVFCCQQLFRPHEDLLPLFFHFYAGLLRNNFQIPHTYKSPFRPAQLKQYKKAPSTTQQRSKPNTQQKVSTTSGIERKTFEQIREKLILTNSIIDNTSPSENVKDKALLLDMIEEIKECEKKVNKTINQNPSQEVMEMALAANDDIFITYRRFKDLQRNKKPQPFILTELVSEAERQRVVKKTQSSTNNSGSNPKVISPVKTQQVKKQNSKQIDFLDFEQQPAKKVEKQPSKKQQNIFDMDLISDPVKKQPAKSGGDIFDLIDSSVPHVQPVPSHPGLNFGFMQNPVQPQPTLNFDLINPVSQPQPQVQINNFDGLLLTGNYQQTIPQPSGNGISLNVNDFATQADIKNYKDQSLMDKFQNMTYEYLKK